MEDFEEAVGVYGALCRECKLAWGLRVMPAT